MTDELKITANDHLNPAHMHLNGFIPNVKTVSYYLASDRIICTSRYETWERMVAEVMLCRRPSVANRIVPATGG